MKGGGFIIERSTLQQNKHERAGKTSRDPDVWASTNCEAEHWRKESAQTMDFRLDVFAMML